VGEEKIFLKNFGKKCGGFNWRGRGYSFRTGMYSLNNKKLF
jgi:hypothetical protein